MKEKNEFSELILDDQNGGNKAKKLMFNAILVIIVILIAMIGYKIFNTNDNTQEEQNTNASFVPTPSSDNISENLIVKQDSGSFDGWKNENISVSEENTFVQRQNENPEPIKITETKEVKTEVKQAIKEVKQDIKKEVAEIKPKPEPKQEQPKKDVFDSIQVQKPTEPKQTIKQNTQKPTLDGNPPKGAYVQILAGDKLDLNSREVKNIKDKGFDFVIYKDPSTGKEKLLVGPHSGKELENKLNEVRAKVKKDAFIFRIK